MARRARTTRKSGGRRSGFSRRSGSYGRRRFASRPRRYTGGAQRLRIEVVTTPGDSAAQALGRDGVGLMTPPAPRKAQF